MKRPLFSLFLLFFLSSLSFAQKKKEISVIGYFAGRATAIDSFPVQKLTHLIFSFAHLKGNRLWINNAGDTACIQKMVSLKQLNPHLKIIISLGGWGGCKDCSAVFSTNAGRKEFARSTKELMQYFQTDGIDLDWEYPAIEGFPGHPYAAADQKNFTSLIRTLRHKLGRNYEISFAAGGFDLFIDSSVEWKKVMRLTDKVNVMNYDLVHGFSKVSGHHTPLYSTAREKQSTDYSVNKLIAEGVPPGKIVIGAAFYARLFQVMDTANNGLYDSARFYRGLSYSKLYDTISIANGFMQYWDAEAQAPYAFNAERKLLATFDDSLSIIQKTKYSMRRKLGGIMFWQLMDDRFSQGLLDVIYQTRMEGKE